MPRRRATSLGGARECGRAAAPALATAAKKKHAKNPPKNRSRPPYELRNIQPQAIKEAYDTLTDDRRRAAYEASSSSSYPHRRGSGGGAAHPGVNTDWTRRHGEGGSRLSRWEWWQRWARQEARTFDRTLHGGLAVLTLAGLLLFDVGGDLFWGVRNRGRSLEAVLEEKRAREEEQQQRLQAEQGGGGQGAAASQAPTGPSRRPGAWLETMRGRQVAADDDGGGEGGGGRGAA